MSEGWLRGTGEILAALRRCRDDGAVEPGQPVEELLRRHRVLTAAQVIEREVREVRHSGRLWAQASVTLRVRYLAEDGSHLYTDGWGIGIAGELTHAVDVAMRWALAAAHELTLGLGRSALRARVAHGSRTARLVLDALDLAETLVQVQQVRADVLWHQLTPWEHAVCRERFRERLREVMGAEPTIDLEQEVGEVPF